MFDFTTGHIQLYRSNFILRSDITPQIVEERLADVIFDRDEPNARFLFYRLWADIEPHEYIYAEIFFADNKLQHISLHPQHQASSPSEKQVHCMDLLDAQNFALSWYQRYFPDKKTEFSWGTISYFEGGDPIYSPPCILITFK